MTNNTLAILASDIVNRAATFVLYALVSRHLGAHEFGQMSLGLTFFQTFQLLAVAGMQTLVTREVAKDRTKTNQYLINGSVSIVLFSVLSMLLLLTVTWSMGYALDTTEVILLFSVSLFPYAVSVLCDAVFQGWERMHYITYANVVVNIFKIGLAYYVLVNGGGLVELALILFGSHVAVLVVKWYLLQRNIIKPQWRFDMRFCWEMSKATLPFLGIDGLIALMNAYLTITLSKMTSEVDVGLFSAATQVLVPVGLVFQSVAISAFPIMSRRHRADSNGLKQISESLLELLLFLVVPTTIGLVFLSEPVLLLLYDNASFAQATLALQVIVWAMMLRVFTQVLGRVLVASMQEKVTLRILIIDSIVTVILGIILIGRMGMVGAAWTTLIVRCVDFVQHYVPVRRSFGGNLALASILWKPAVASGAMAWYLTVANQQPLYVQIGVGAAIYAAVLSVLMTLTIGGPARVKARYLQLASEA
ncbi:MAG: flippase [Caldilineaceae bacterium]